MGDRQWFVLYVLVCLEVGIFLVLVPWSAIWERNYFLEAYPSLRPILLSPVFRGAVAGLGVANIYVGLNEVLKRRYRIRRAPPGEERAMTELRPETSARGLNDEERNRSEAYAASEDPG